jgi:acetylornithine deacetylase/succinyl-diaminopimelate desuccinylase-like protein
MRNGNNAIVLLSAKIDTFKEDAILIYMSPQDIPQLDNIDLQQFEQLIGMESFTWDGQEKKMKLIQTLVNQRLTSLREKIREELIHLGWNSSRADGEAKNRTSNISQQTVTLENGQKQFVFGRGDHARGVKRKRGYDKNPPLNILIPAHIDTVGINGEQKLLEFHHDAGNPDHIKARGTYDMLGAALNSIALISDIRVPRGMNVFFAFTFDEEIHSAGAKALMKSWDWWKDIDIVLSSEIGHIDRPENDAGMSLIMGRRGRQKYHVALEVQDAGRGHFAEGHVRSASTGMHEAGFLNRERFFHAKLTGKSKLQQTHPFFGDETLQDGDALSVSSSVSDQKKMQDPTKPLHSANSQTSSPTDIANMYYNILSVPPRTLQSSLEQQQRVFDDIAKYCNWASHSIHCTVTQNEMETSYEPFEMPQNHPLVNIVRNNLAALSGEEVQFAYAPSVADENLYAADLRHRSPQRKSFLPHQGVLSIPYLGDNAHRIDEWVSVGDLARVRHAIRGLLESSTGLIQLRETKRQMNRKR